MSRNYNEDVENSKRLEEILGREEVEVTRDGSGKKSAGHSGGWLAWRSGEFGRTEAKYISNTLRVWGFLLILLMILAGLGYLWVMTL